MKTRTATALVACLFATLLGCSGSVEEPTDTGKLFINLNTGETTEFADGESVPPDYAVCSEEGCPEPYPCSEIDPNSCTVRSDCAVSYSPGCDPSVEDCTAAGCAGTAPEACDPSECPAEISLIAMICDDGSVATPACERLSDGTCDYVHRCDDDCGPEDCDAIPEIAMICDDGSMAEPVCEKTSAGQCGIGFVCGTVSSPSCEPEDCGPAPAIAKICPDGSDAEMVCTPDANEACGWGFDCSATVQCTPADCEGKPFSGYTCPEGGEALAECMATTEGVCEWTGVCPM